jgi:glutaminyl-peptide cyclotransferase
MRRLRGGSAKPLMSYLGTKFCFSLGGQGFSPDVAPANRWALEWQLGARNFRSDISPAFALRLQPLRNSFCGGHPDSSASEIPRSFTRYFRDSALARIASLAIAVLLPLTFTGCKSRAHQAKEATGSAPFMSTVAGAPPQSEGEDALPPEKTGGFDGKRAYAHVVKQVGFGPRPSGSQAIAQEQDYILSELSSYGCAAETQAFNTQTPAGQIAMKNILVKIPGDKPGMYLLGTHYDTKKMDNFVGADDGGSSTAVILEIARVLCAHQATHPVWIAFFDGEEALQQWSDTDSRYGSREMAARLAMSGDLPKIKAFLLADIVGNRYLRFKQESNSTKALTDLVWSTANKLGYSAIFVNDATAIEDDHLSFLKRGVPCVDVIDLEIPYWHTPQDTLDKISARSLAITGHTFLESLRQLQQR